MRKEGKKQNKFKHFILTPIRILKKAKELYVKGVVNCAGALAVGAASSVQISHHTHGPNKSVCNQTRVERETSVPMPINQTVRFKYNRTKMSYHTEVRKMGTIDEDKPCYFEEDQNGSTPKPNLLYLYPRTRLCLVNKRAVYYQ
ncbi:uncharacterized protein LOC114915511 [Cajanus cajan]|uniref:Uncharacterized protein n=1 Tax=Cajanus cajan TaxID=3821 RepID=A0A151QQ54_CAJCA|nr:uncharacterized protein LOC114915511 [Cajanus cajan]KYP32428.1 hypothetical protein KK1_046907 [Cajanus cajan]